MLGYVNKTDPVYQRTRRFVLSKDNPYYMYGPVINGYVPSHSPLFFFYFFFFCFN